MSASSPDLFPSGGLRPLNAREILQRAKALNCTVPSSNRPACSGQLHIGLFFDGTGNNMEADYKELPPERRRHSNIVRLFNAFRVDNERGYFAYYIPGVGTPFPEIGDGGGTLGSAGAWDGEARIIWAFTRLINSPHIFTNRTELIPADRAGRIATTVDDFLSPAWQRKAMLASWQEKLARALDDAVRSGRPRVEQINLSVFGFSRGAAEARAFSNWLFQACKKNNGGWEFGGIPIRLQFLGIFDTVASVGIADLFSTGFVEGHQSWADNNMEIHSGVEQCVHYVAAHEVRACFPLDSVRKGNSYPANVKEVVYPGAHSDVGGGYAPNDLGISAKPGDSIAVIPCVNMYREAYKAGVPFRSWEELDSGQKADFTPAPTAVEAFNEYLRAADIAPGPVEEMHFRHMGLFFSYRFKYRVSLKGRPFFQRALPRDKRYLVVTERTLLERLRKLQYPVPVENEGYDPKKAVALQQSMMKAAGLESQNNGDRKLKELYKVVSSIDIKKLTPEIERLFDNYVHDSMAGFMGMGVNEYDGAGVKLRIGNGMGITKFRRIYSENG